MTTEDKTTEASAPKKGPVKGRTKIAIALAGVGLLVGAALNFGLIDRGSSTAVEVARETWKLSVKLVCGLPEASRFGVMEAANAELADEGRGGTVACTAEEVESLPTDDSAEVDAVVQEAAEEHDEAEADVVEAVETAVGEAEAAGVDIPVEAPEAPADAPDDTAAQ